MEDRSEKLRLLRERRAKVNILERAEEITQVTPGTTKGTEEHPAVEKVTKHRKILDTYRTGNYFAKRSNSAVDLRHESMQTDPELLNNHTASIRKPTRLSMDQIKSSIIMKRASNVLGFAAPMTRHSFTDADMQVQRPVIEDDDKKFEVKDMKPEAQVKVLKSDKFTDYFFNASKFVEKVLVKDETGRKKTKTLPSNSIKEEFVISCPSHFKNMTVNNLNWSYLVPEVFLSTYMSKEEEINISTEADKIYVWNVNFIERPEFELVSPQRIERAIFSPFSSELVIAGCQSGKICLYDLRAKKDPISKSSPSSESHRSSITGLEFVGGRNSNNLISVSEEGRLCVWTLQNLDTPLRKIDLHPVVNQNKPEVDSFDFLIEPFALSSILGDTSGAFIGGVDGNIYQCAVLSSSGNYQNAKTFLNVFKGHKSIVNCLHHNKANNISSQLSSLMLSGSFDWSVKLWSVRENRLLYDFKNHQDPITDVNWNPTHPAMFSSCDASGTVKVFNLLKNFDQPVHEFEVGDCVFNSKWDSTGEKLAISDNNGNVLVKHFNREFFAYNQTDIKVFETSVNTA